MWSITGVFSVRMLCADIWNAAIVIEIAPPTGVNQRCGLYAHLQWRIATMIQRTQAHPSDQHQAVQIRLHGEEEDDI
jgi:hypothetical protein